MGIHTEGLDKLLGGFNKLDKGMQAAIKKAMSQSLQNLASNAKYKWPVHTGESSASLGNPQKGGILDINTLGIELVGRIGSKKPQSSVIEFGRRAGKRPPPSDVIEEWAIKHGMPGLGYIIARAIGRRGLPAQHILQKTKEAGISMVADTFGKVLKDHVEDSF